MEAWAEIPEGIGSVLLGPGNAQLRLQLIETHFASPENAAYHIHFLSQPWASFRFDPIPCVIRTIGQVAERKIAARE